MIWIRVIIVWACLMLSLVCSAQFTLDNEYAKQHKKYPFITRYVVTSSGLKCSYDVEYGVVGDRHLTMDVFEPAERSTGRCVIYIHGGGWASGSKEMDHPMAMSLAHSGIVTFCVDYRLSGEAMYPAAIDDVKNAIRWIKEHADEYGIDSDEICLAGSSAGGQMAALIGMNTDKDKSCHVERVIDIDGVLCFIHPDSSEGHDKPGKVSAVTQWLGVSSTENLELWNSASAFYNVNANSADFLFMNSAQKRFSAGQGETKEKLVSFGHDVKEYKTTNTPHTFWLFNPWAEDAVRAMIDYILDK